MNNPDEIITANLILPLLKDLLLPKIKKVVTKLSMKNFDESCVTANFEEYLSQRYEKFLIIDTLVFPNKQTLFKNLYEPLTLVTKINSDDKIKIVIDEYPKQFLPEFFRVIIEDTAGMGKSTVTKKLFLSCIEQNAGIPILIELRQINKQNDFLKELQNQLSPIGKQIPLDVLINLLNEGEFVFLFDGFDEISKADKEFVIKDLHRFIEKANNNYFLITSRAEDSLVSFGDFQKFNIQPLKKKQAYSLIKRYDTYSFKPISEQLLKQLENNKENTLKDFLSNPFLLSLLYKSFEYKKDIPLKKTQFYRQVYDALFESHDLSKEGYLKRDKHSNLHIDDFERVLRYVGYLTAIENKIEYDKNYILDIIDKAKKYVPDLVFKSSDYLKDLLETVPLFKKDGNYIKWGHKSLQDYFAAKFIWNDATTNQESILKKMYSDKDNRRFYNLLDLFYELDINIFENTILFWLLEDFENYTKSSYTNFKDIPSDLIKRRIENNFNKECTLVVTKQEDYNDVSTNNKNSSKVREYYRKLGNIKDYQSSTHYNYFKKQQIIVLAFISFTPNIDTILKLISSKLPDLGGYKTHPYELDNLMILEEDHAYILDDIKDNIINSKKIFELVTKLSTGGYTLNYEKVLNKLKQIRNKKDAGLQSELTNW